jgi:integrase/recombinase XerD
MQNTGCRPWDDNEVNLVLGACRGRYALRDRALVITGVYTGFRIGEILALTVADVWRGADVYPSVTVGARHMKGRKYSRTLPLHDRAREAIRFWVVAMQSMGMVSMRQPLFPRQRRHRSLTRHQARRIILAAATRAGVSTHRVATHTLRKTFARRLWNSPLIQKDPAKMAKLLGHRNWANTLRYLEFDCLEAAILA